MCFLTGNSRQSCRHFFENKNKKRSYIQCCPGNVLIPSISAVIPIFRENCDIVETLVSDHLGNSNKLS